MKMDSATITPHARSASCEFPIGTCRLVQSFKQDTQDHHISDFEILAELGQGKYGTVFAARDKRTDFIVALKRLSRAQLHKQVLLDQLRRQILIQSAMRHQNVLKMYGYFWDQTDIYLVLQFAVGGQLYKALTIRGHFEEQDVSVIIRQVCQGLKYIHQNAVIHRDIKPENLLLSVGLIKIADFGWSVHSRNKRNTICGTLDYLAPEMVRGSSHCQSVDVWCVGILAFELAVGRPPFEDRSSQQTYKNILHSELYFPDHISFQLRSFVRRALQKNPHKRMTLQQALIDPFITQYLSFSLSTEENELITK